MKGPIKTRLLNRKQVKEFALAVAQGRFHRFTRVVHRYGPDFRNRYLRSIVREPIGEFRETYPVVQLCLSLLHPPLDAPYSLAHGINKVSKPVHEMCELAAPTGHADEDVNHLTRQR